MSDLLPKCEDCHLRRIALCAAFLDDSPTEYTNLIRKYDHFKARSLIYRSGTIPETLYIVHHGWTAIYRILSNGRRQIFDFRIPGDSIGARTLNRAPLKVSVQAITDVDLCAFGRDDFVERAMQRPELAMEFHKRSIGYIHLLEDRLVETCFFSAASCVAFLILSLRERLLKHDLIEGNDFDFPLTQGHIGDALGLTTAHVNRTLRELRAKKLLTIDKGRLIIHDLEQLSVLAHSAAG